MIKFPSTVEEYTDGKLWHNGVDESIARRLLVGLHKLDDERELDLRTMYLAYFYFSIGDFGIAMTLAKSFLMQNKYIDDAIDLIKRICIKDKDMDMLARITSLATKLNKGPLPMNFFDNVDAEDLMVFEEDTSTGKGRVIHTEDGMAEYYQNGKKIFSVEDPGPKAFFQDSAARFLIGEGKAEVALEFLADIRLDKLKLDMKLLCHQSYVRAYCMLEQYMDAYEYCELLMQNKIYLPEMTEILAHLYYIESPRFYELREFLLSYKGYESVQLGDLHSLSKDIDDKGFWLRIYDNNPIDPQDLSEGAYIFKGMLAFNDADYELAEMYFKQATALYGRFGKSWFYRYFIDLYLKKLKKSPYVEDMPYELYTSQIDEVYNCIDKKLFSKLKKCLKKEDFLKNVDDNMLELDNMISGDLVKTLDIVKIINKVYAMDYAPARALINRVIVDEEYDIVMRSVCLANYLMYGKQKKLVLGRHIYDNPLSKKLKSSINTDKFPVLYGMAIFLATSMIGGIEEKGLKAEYKILEGIFSHLKSDYSQISPFAVFGVLVGHFSQEEIHYDKDIIKKREVKEFATAVAIDMDIVDDDGKMLNDDLSIFLKYCIYLAE